MPRWPKKVASPANPVEEVAPPAIDPVDDNRRLSSNEPTAIEKAMEMLIISNANTQVLLGEIDDTMNKVVDGIQKINDTAKNSVDHQLDLDEMRKSKPFKLKMLYQIDQRTIDLGD
jgi:hypothetical protein